MTLEQVETELAAAEKNLESLREIRRNLWREERRKQEDLAGSPKVGDTVVCREQYGQLAIGHVGKVVQRWQEMDCDNAEYALDHWCRYIAGRKIIEVVVI